MCAELLELRLILTGIRIQNEGKACKKLNVKRNLKIIYFAFTIQY